MPEPLSGLDINSNWAFLEKAAWYTLGIVNLVPTVHENKRVREGHHHSPNILGNRRVDLRT
jgi:hypothetical protein